MKRSLFLLLVLIAFGGSARAQAGAVDQIQAVVAGPITGHAARTLTDHLAKHPGVRLCRIDPVSRNVLLHVDPDFGMNEQALRNLFRIHGLHLRCFIRAPRTNAPFHLLDPRSCGHHDSAR